MFSIIIIETACCRFLVWWHITTFTIKLYTISSFPYFKLNGSGTKKSSSCFFIKVAVHSRTSISLEMQLDVASVDIGSYIKQGKGDVIYTTNFYSNRSYEFILSLSWQHSHNVGLVLFLTFQQSTSKQDKFTSAKIITSSRVVCALMHRIAS